MSRSVNEASGSGFQVAETITEVATSVQLTTTGAQEAHRAAGELALMSTQLRDLVDNFTV